MTRAIDSLIMSIEEDIKRMKTRTLAQFIGITAYNAKMQEYRAQLNRALFHKRREEELYG